MNSSTSELLCRKDVGHGRLLVQGPVTCGPGWVEIKHLYTHPRPTTKDPEHFLHSSGCGMDTTTIWVHAAGKWLWNHCTCLCKGANNSAHNCVQGFFQTTTKKERGNTPRGTTGPCKYLFPLPPPPHPRTCFLSYMFQYQGNLFLSGNKIKLTVLTSQTWTYLMTYENHTLSRSAHHHMGTLGNRTEGHQMPVLKVLEWC